MHLRLLVVVGLLITGAGCGGTKLKNDLRDEYCADLESSPTQVDSALATTASMFEGLRMTQGALQSAIDDGGNTENLLWLMGGNCSDVARIWAEGVGNARAFHRTWWNVRLKTGELIIEPPTAPALSKELEKMCYPEGLRINPANRAESVRAAVARREAALVELRNEQKRWASDRDKGLARCEAAGWQRRHEKGYYERAIPGARGADAGAK